MQTSGWEFFRGEERAARPQSRDCRSHGTLFALGAVGFSILFEENSPAPGTGSEFFIFRSSPERRFF
jgi:hypothetical protein